MKRNYREIERYRRECDQQELALRINHLAKKEGRNESHPGVFFNRLSTANKPIYGVLEPSFCVIAQGTKQITLGDEKFVYDPSSYLIGTMNLPVTAQTTDATPERPYLAFRLALDPALVASVLVEAGISGNSERRVFKGLDVSPLDPELLNATLRLVRVVEQPEQYRVLGPLSIREIVYRLATGAQGARLRHMTSFGGPSRRMAQAVESLRQNFYKPLRVEDLAEDVSMSLSSFHAHFKSTTSMSPLQFQKQMRLQEARRLMLSEELDAAEAGYKVGYEDASYFSRDYKRHFGEPPKRDVARLRVSASPATGTPA